MYLYLLSRSLSLARVRYLSPCLHVFLSPCLSVCGCVLFLLSLSLSHSLNLFLSSLSHSLFSLSFCLRLRLPSSPPVVLPAYSILVRTAPPRALRRHPLLLAARRLLAGARRVGVIRGKATACCPPRRRRGHCPFHCPFHRTIHRPLYCRPHRLGRFD